MPFFNNLVSSLTDAKSYSNIHSDDPQFRGLNQLEGKSWLLECIDDESVDSTIEELIELMEKANHLKIESLGNSLNDYGLRYDFVVYIANGVVECAWRDYMAENNLQYLEEVVAPRNMSFNAKVDLLSKQLINIGSKGSQLIVVDPYIFPPKHYTNYEDLLVQIITKSKTSMVKFITDSRCYDLALRVSVEQKLSIPISVFDSNKYHDRWWIVGCNILILGLSLNGFGRDKLTTITPMSTNDALTIISDIGGVMKVL
ncbi:hypothetical protein FACS1894187_23970 [Synergistales bacterium]|nr:hypothetical protein FACS1894187_23970 [Synergistales bacterium]